MEPDTQILRREPPTTKELAGWLESREFVQDGKEVKCDDYGRPINVRAVESYKSHNASLMLSARYHNWELTKQERAEAGEALGYSSIRIWLHERTRVIRSAFSRMGRKAESLYETTVFDKGRALIDNTH